MYVDVYIRAVAGWIKHAKAGCSSYEWDSVRLQLSAVSFVNFFICRSMWCEQSVRDLYIWNKFLLSESSALCSYLLLMSFLYLWCYRKRLHRNQLRWKNLNLMLHKPLLDRKELKWRRKHSKVGHCISVSMCQYVNVSLCQCVSMPMCQYANMSL